MFSSCHWLSGTDSSTHETESIRKTELGKNPLRKFFSPSSTSLSLILLILPFDSDVLSTSKSPSHWCPSISAVRLVKRTQREARKTTPVDAFDRFQQAPPPLPLTNKNKIKHTHTHPCTVRQLLIHDATTTSWDSFPENHPVNVNV